MAAARFYKDPDRGCFLYHVLEQTLNNTLNGLFNYKTPAWLFCGSLFQFLLSFAASRREPLAEEKASPRNQSVI